MTAVLDIHAVPQTFLITKAGLTELFMSIMLFSIFLS
jgi:hypothetical protein